MTKIIREILSLFILTLFLTSTTAMALTINTDSVAEEKLILVSSWNEKVLSNETEDLDPLVDLQLTITIKEIRAFDKIDQFSDPDFYVKLIVNEDLPATFDVFGFGSDTVKFADNESFDIKKLVPEYNNLMRHLGGDTKLYKAVQVVVEEISSNHSDKENIIFIITDVGVQPQDIFGLTNLVTTADAKKIFVAVQGKYDFNPDAVKLFGDYNITGPENADEILQRVLLASVK